MWVGISKTLPAISFCVSSSRRYRHVPCYIRAALHLSSDSHTPTNYPPGDTKTHLHTPMLSPPPCSKQPHPGSHTRRNYQHRCQTPAAPKWWLLSALPDSLRYIFPSLKFPSHERRVDASSTRCLLSIWNLTLFILITFLPTYIFHQIVEKSCVSFYLVFRLQ